MLHKIIPGAVGLASALSSVGLQGPYTVMLAAEDGEKLADAVQAQSNVSYVPYDPAEGELFLTMTVAGVVFKWPAPESPSDV